MEYRSLLDSVVNMRELGGLPVMNGKTIRKGYFYRSGALDAITPADQKKLEELKIGTVLDLRTPAEAERKPDWRGSFRYVNAPAFRESEPEPGTRHIPTEELYKTMNEGQYIYKKYEYSWGYRHFPFNPEMVLPLLEALDEQRPILFHCAGGKDRTGVIGIILCTIFGVPEEDARENYMMTNAYGKERFAESYRKFDEKYSNPWARKTQRFFTEAMEEFFDICWHAIHSQYATAEDYLFYRFGVSAERVKDWREFYLE